jgi:hypothetical protein
MRSVQRYIIIIAKQISTRRRSHRFKLGVNTRETNQGILFHDPSYKLRAKENFVYNFFGLGDVCHGIGGSLEVLHQLMVSVGVLAVWVARLLLTPKFGPRRKDPRV